MELEQTGEPSVPVRKVSHALTSVSEAAGFSTILNASKDPKHVEPEPTRQTTNNHSFADDVEYTQRIPTIKDGAQMVRPLILRPIPHLV
jgi:hypothetical protein